MRPFIHASLVLQSEGNHRGGRAASLFHIPVVSVLVQEMDVCVEESLIKRLLSWATPVATADDDDSDSDREEAADRDFAAARVPHGVISRELQPHRGAALAPLQQLASGARDRLAASIMRAAAAPRRRQDPMARSSGGLRALRAVTRRVSAAAKRDLARLKSMQHRAAVAVRHGAGTLARGLRSIADGGPVVPARATTRTRITKRSAPTTTFTLDAAPVTYGMASEVADTASALADDIQWWWPRQLAPERAGATPQQRQLQLYVQHMRLPSLAVNVSFMRDPAAAAAGYMLASRNHVTAALAATLSAISIMAISTKRAPLRLNGLELVNVLATSTDLRDRVAQHYVSAALAELYKIVLSMDVLGNPVAVVSALGSGVRDFFVEPARGLVQSPVAFARGLGKGSVSLLTNTFVGLGTGVSGVLSTAGRGLQLMSFDDAYMRERAARGADATGPTGIVSGVMQGGMMLVRGTLDAASGVVMQPLRGAQEDGITGFVKGVGTGVMGAVVKPVIAVADAAAAVSDGIVATAKHLGGHAGAGGPAVPRRSQRIFWGIDRTIIPWEPVHEIIVALLRRALEAAVQAADQDDASTASSAASVKPTASARSNVKGATAGSSAGKAGQAASSGDSSASTIVSDLRDMVTGRQRALTLALTGVSSTYMHHIFWPKTPYLLIISSRAIMLATVSRSAGSSMPAAARGLMTTFEGLADATVAFTGATQVHLCWQSPVVTPSAMAAATAAALNPSQRINEHVLLGRETATDLLDTAAAVSGPEAPGGHGRSAATIGLLAGHVAYSTLLDAMSEMCADAAAVPMRTYVRAGRGPTRPVAATAEPAAIVATSERSRHAPRRATIHATPAALMVLDGVVQQSLKVLADVPVEDDVFSLPRYLLDAMTVAVEPMPLHFADAKAELANVRLDLPPQTNVQSITYALAHIDSAWTAYVGARVEHLMQVAAGGGPQAGAAEAERARLERSKRLGADDITPLFNHLLARTQVDHPVLVAVVASMWLAQQGLVEGMDGYALSTFKGACLWASSITINRG